MFQYSILIVDDDPTSISLLREQFEKDYFAVQTAVSGDEAFSLLEKSTPSLIVLDLVMPEMDGWEICRRIRKNQDTPILMLSDRHEESELIVSLELGADDYVTKPFRPKEIVARTKAILRRTNQTLLRPEPLKREDLSIDPESYQVFRGETSVALTPTEFKILHLLAGRQGKVFSRLQIVEETQGYAYNGYERSIDSHIKNLRHKIELDPKKPKYILTIHGLGYKFAHSSI